MRAIWTGALGFGLINIPIRVFSGSKERALNFDMLHKKDLSPIRFARICKADGKEIPYQDIVKGYEYQPGDYVVLTDEDFKNASPKKTKLIEVIDFTNENEIDPIFYEKPYFLEPGKGAGKAYAILRDALRKSKRVGIAKYVLHNKEHIGVVKPYGKLLVVIQLRYANEINDASQLDVPETEHSDKEVNMAIKLIDELTTHFKPEKYHDTYIEDLEKLIAEKAHGKKPRKKGREPKITPVKDIMSLLKESLEEHQRKTA